MSAYAGTYAILGLLGLAIVWTTGLLMAAAAFQDAAPVARFYARLRNARTPLTGPRASTEHLSCDAVLVRGALGVRDASEAAVGADASGDGVICDGSERRPQVTLRIEQIGRAIDMTAKPPQRGVAFQDRAFMSRVHAAAVITPSGTTFALPEGDATVWPAASTFVDPEHHDGPQAVRAARGARGLLRTLEGHIATGEDVWVFGRWTGASFVATPEEPLLVSARNPFAFCRSALGLTALFVVGELGLLAACTALAFTAPVFGPWSTVGGLACLGHFLAVQPVGSTWLKGKLRFPHQTYDGPRVLGPFPVPPVAVEPST